MSELTLSTITVSGEDAFEFLQNQVTNDLLLLDSEPEILAAWCSPKGRVIWFGTVQKADSAYALSAPAETAQDIVDRLTVFRFRAKVEFSVEENTGTIDPAELIRNGYAFIGRDQVEEFTPHMLNLDLIGAVSLDKGCYPGQEIVARTHYRGKTKRRLFRFQSDEPVAPGDRISDGSREVGEVINAAGNDLLAVVPIDKAGDALKVGAVSLERLPLPGIDIPGSEPSGSDPV
jgi:folate-binding protein YgfZ